MNRAWFKPFASVALALSLAAVSCDKLPTEAPVSPDPQAAVQASAIARVNTSAAVIGTYHFVTTNDTGGGGGLLDLTQILGLLGGILHLDNHTLTVPRGAVLLPTLFSMSVVKNGHVQVQLHALLQTLLGLLDIGGRGFLKPVTLSLSYANANNVTNPSHLHVALLNADGTINSILPSTVDTVHKTVSADLPHFSSYVLVCD